MPGVDCGGTFTPVHRLQSIDNVQAVAIEIKLIGFQPDVQTTFLNANLEEDVNVKMAPGYENANKTRGPQ